MWCVLLRWWNMIDSNFKIGFEWSGKERVNNMISNPIRKEARLVQHLGNTYGNLINYYYICDNLDGLRYLEQNTDSKYDLVYLDPPYNTSRIKLRSRFPEKNGCGDCEIAEIIDTRDTINKEHVRWLNNIYPRLKLAHQLMSDKGVIILSIDDTEFASLRIICDEIFGPENFIECIVWEREYGLINNKVRLFHNHDYNLIYSKNSELLFKSSNFKINPHSSLWRCDTAGSSFAAKEELATLMGGKVLFDYPKPQKLLQKLFELYSDKNSKVLDFYAGSASTAEAVMELNRKDRGNRTFTLMQSDVLLENSDNNSEILSVPQLGIERISNILCLHNIQDTQVLVKQLI